MRTLQLLLCASLTLLLSACASTPAPVSYYDLGDTPQSTFKCNLPPIYVADVMAIDALDSNLMSYRLLYSNEQQTRFYANARWTMTPSQLLTVRIKNQLANSGVTVIGSGVSKADSLQLRIELEKFTQYFSDPSHSYAQIQMRATTTRDNKLLAQTTMQQQTDARAPDSAAGALAMRGVSDELIRNLGDWLCKRFSQ